MSSPEPDEVLFAYIAVAPYAVSLVLIRVDNGVQRPVYYVSKSLHKAEVRYLPLEKAILAVVLGTRKLPHYFQAHTVVILTQLPLKTILRSANYIGRIAKWGYNSRGFRHQIHASYLHKRTSPHGFGGRIHRTRDRRTTIEWKYG